jgi:ubiquinone/menaquinone biosynthesis C-methylase UbiE
MRKESRVKYVHLGVNMGQESYDLHMEFVKKSVSYNKYLVDSVWKYMGARILDVGCGIGTITSLFLKDKFIVGMDISDYYLSKFRQNVKEVQAFNIDIAGENTARFFKDYSFDTIFCSNVLEHIENDDKALKNMCAILESGGVLILIVPNHKFLYGTLDKADLHYRRYSRREISDKLLSAGFIVERVFCINFLGVFWWYLQSKILRVTTNNESEATIVNVSMPIVRFLDKLLSYSDGLSLVCIVKKEALASN